MATTMRLYETADALGVVNAWLDEHADEILANGGALPPALEQLLDEAEGNLKTKAEAVALKVRELQASCDAAKGEAARLAQRAATFDKAAESLKGYLKAQLLRAGETSIKTPLVSIRVQANPPKLDVADAAALVPLGYATQPAPVTPPPQVDRAALLAKHDDVRARAIEEAAALELDDHERNNVACGVAIEAELEGWDESRKAAELEVAYSRRLNERRDAYVRAALAAALPGVSVTRAHHLRIS